MFVKRKEYERDLELFKDNIRSDYDCLYKAHYELLGKYERLMKHLKLSETVVPQKIILDESKER